MVPGREMLSRALVLAKQCAGSAASLLAAGQLYNGLNACSSRSVWSVSPMKVINAY